MVWAPVREWEAILDSVVQDQSGTALDGARDLVESLCLLAERLTEGALASVMLLDGEGVLRLFAAPSVPEAARERLDGLRPGPESGSCGNAVLRNDSVFVSQTLRDPRWAGLRDLAEEFTLLACWSTPIRNSYGNVLGTFALSSFTERAPNREQVRLLESIAAVIADVLFQEERDGRDRCFAAALRAIDEGVVLTDAEQRVVYANPAFLRLSGYELAEILGKNCRFLQGPDTDPATRQSLHDALAEGRVFHGDILNYRRDGTPFWNALNISPVRDAQGHITHFVSVQRDVTLSRRTEQELRLSAQAFETQEGILITDAQRRIVKVNQAFTRVTGYTLEEVRGLTPAILQSGNQDADFYEAMWREIEREGAWQGEIWNRRKNGEVYPEFLSITAVQDGNGQVSHYIGHFFDISHHKAREATLERLARHDPLTDLLNRRALDEELLRAQRRADAQERLLAVVMLDLDDFKPINDRYGHDQGDALLVLVAQRLRDHLRRSDAIARLGGDEFVLMLEGLRQLDELEPILDKLQRALCQPYRLRDGVEVHIGVSMGVSIYPFSAQGNLDELLREADQALFAAKQQKGQRLRPWSFWEPPQSAMRLYPLRERFRAQGAEAWFQPVWDQQSGRVVGIEALARLRGDDGSVLAPGEFLPQLQETDIFDLTNQILEQSLTALTALDDLDPELWVSVNLDPQLIGITCLKCVQQMLQGQRIAPQRIVFELLESGDFLDRRLAQDHLLDLKAIGVRLALDDIGSGYSSLLRLKELPIDKIKLDQSFVRGLEERPGDLHFVEALLELSSSLNVELVAEGVETAAIRDAVAVAGVRYLQGYAIARPMPLDALRNFLVSGCEPLRQSGPRSLLGIYAEQMSEHAVLRKALRQSWTILDLPSLRDPQNCPTYRDICRLPDADAQRILAVYRDYHEAIAAFADKDAEHWMQRVEELERQHRRLSDALLDAIRVASATSSQ